MYGYASRIIFQKSRECTCKGNCAFHKNKRDSSETFFLLVSCVVESAYDILSSNEFILNVKKHTVFDK